MLVKKTGQCAFPFLSDQNVREWYNRGIERRYQLQVLMLSRLLKSNCTPDYARMLICFTFLIPWTAIPVPFLSLAEKHTEKNKFWGVFSHSFGPFLSQLTWYQGNILTVVEIKVWDKHTDISAIIVLHITAEAESSHLRNLSLKTWDSLY